MTVVSSNVDINAKQREQLAQKAQRSLMRLSNRVKAIKVTFTDVNGPKGGKDTMCKMLVAISKAKNIVISVVQENFVKAFSEALSKAKNALKSRVSRRTADRGKRPVPMPVTHSGIETLAEHRWQR